MNALKHRLTLEMTVLHSQAKIHIKKDDTKNKLIISLTENNKPYEITNNVRAVFVGKKPDGKIIFNECDVVGNTIEYTITAQTSVAVGMVTCELRLYDNDNNLLTSPRFTVVVDEITFDENHIEIESTNEINVLDSLITKANALLEASKRGEFKGEKGADGTTFIPYVNPLGVLSWFNDKGLENPEQYNLQKALIEIAGWSEYPSNKIEDKRWYRAQGEVELTIWVNALTTDGKPLAWDGQLILHPDSRGYSTFKLEDMEKGTASVVVGILQSTTSSIPFEYSSVVVSFVDALLAYGADAKLGEITSVYILVESNGQTLYRNGPADGTAVDLNAYLTTSKFNDYINGLYTTPHIITTLLNVLGRAVFEHTVVVQEPVDNNNPATKGYVDNLLSYFNGDLTIPMAVIQALGVLGEANFEGAITVPAPETDNNPATKKYVDDLFANIKLAEDGEY